MSKTGLHSTVAKPNEVMEEQSADWSAKATDLGEAKKMLQTINFKLGNFDDENRSFRAIASTALVDRQGDSIEQSGWVLDNFVKNPVIPWAHCYWELPVARAVEIGVVDGNLQMTVQFPPEGLYDFADTVWEMYRHGFMFAFSVGFIPIEYEGNWEDGYNFTKCELLEVSAVPVPANAGALVLAQKMGIMDNKAAKQMIAKVELALNNFKEANGMKKNEAVVVEETTEITEELGDAKTTTKKTVKKASESPEEKPVTLAEVKALLEEMLNTKDVQEDEEVTDDTKGLTNDDTMVQTDNMTEQKSGAKISADTKAKIKEVMDGLQQCMVDIKSHHDKLADLHNVGTDAEDDSQNDDPNADDETTDGKKSVEVKKPKADDAKVIEGEVKSAENDSEDGADHEDEEEAKEDESVEDDSTVEEAKAVETPEVKAVEDESKEDEESVDEDDTLVDPDNLSDDDVAKIAAAVQAELDKEDTKE